MVINESLEELNNKVYELIFGTLPLNMFEQWVYHCDRLKMILSEDEYIDLISIDYRKQSSKYEIEKVLKSYLNYSAFEKRKMIKLLQDALIRNDELPNILIAFYNLYCDGYYFLQDLGLGYGLSCEVPPSESYSAQTWDELKDTEKTKLLNSFYPELEDDLKRALDWISSSKIILTGTKGDLNRWEYIDNRTETEKKSSMWVETYNNAEEGVSVSKNVLREKKSKKWWQFWK